MHIKHNDYQLTILRQFGKKSLTKSKSIAYNRNFKGNYRYTQNFSLHISESLFCKTDHYNRHADKIGIMFATRTIQRLSPHIKILIACCRWDDTFVSFPAKKCSFLAMDICIFLGACRWDEGNASAEWLCPLSCVVETPTWTILEVLSSRFHRWYLTSPMLNEII